MENQSERDLTPLEYIVLGLIGIEPQSGYSLMSYFGSDSSSWSASPGSIYPMLKRLEGNALIVGEMIAEHELRPRKMYRLTKEGEVLLLEWLKQMPKLSPFYQERELALWRFQLMEKWFSKDDILTWLQRYLENISFHLASSNYYKQGIEALPKGDGGYSIHQWLSLQAHTIDAQAVKTWIELAISRLKGEIHADE